VPGCGRGHEVALAVEPGLDATVWTSNQRGLPRRAWYPHLAERFVAGDCFDLPEKMRGAHDVVLEHTCISALPPTLRADYRAGIDLPLRAAAC
jgi:methyl halide transferase